MEVRVCTSLDTREVTLLLDEGATCADALRQLKEDLQLPSPGKGAWQLEEEWQGCSELCIMPALIVCHCVPLQGIV